MLNKHQFPSFSLSPCHPQPRGATCTGRKHEKACSVGFYWQIPKNNNLFHFPQAPSYPHCDSKARLKSAPGHWNTRQSDNPHHGPIQCSAGGNQVLLGILKSPRAQRPWLLFSSFLSFVVEHLGRGAGSVLALVRGPLSPGCVSPIPAMSEPIRGHSAEAFEGVIGL